MIRIAFALILLLLTVSCSAKPGLDVRSPQKQVPRAECVVLLHGMGRSSGSMHSMQRALVAEGYDTVNVSYPSTKKNIETIVREDYLPAVARCLSFSPKSIHFVTHSLGGIVVRKALSESKPKNLGRVVMLSPPNQGSQLVDKIKDWWLFRVLMGPAGQQLVSGEKGVPGQLGGADFSLGIITGNRHSLFDSWFASVIPGKDDGKVSIESARLEGMEDFLITEDTHPFIMNSKYVQIQTIHFLQKGKFNHAMPRVESPPGHDWFSEDS